MSQCYKLIQVISTYHIYEVPINLIVQFMHLYISLIKRGRFVYFDLFNTKNDSTIFYFVISKSMVYSY